MIKAPKVIHEYKYMQLTKKYFDEQNRLTREYFDQQFQKMVTKKDFDKQRKLDQLLFNQQRQDDKEYLANALVNVQNNLENYVDKTLNEKLTKQTEQLEEFVLGVKDQIIEAMDYRFERSDKLLVQVAQTVGVPVP